MKDNCTTCAKAVWLGECPCCHKDVYVCVQYDNLFHDVYDKHEDCYVPREADESGG